MHNFGHYSWSGDQEIQVGIVAGRKINVFLRVKHDIFKCSYIIKDRSKHLSSWSLIVWIKTE